MSTLFVLDVVTIIEERRSLKLDELQYLVDHPEEIRDFDEPFSQVTIHKNINTLFLHIAILMNMSSVDEKNNVLESNDQEDNGDMFVSTN